MRKWIIPLLVVVLVFAFAAPAVAAPGLRGKPVFVSHVFTNKVLYRVSQDGTATVKAWGYIKPKLINSDDATLTIKVYKKIGRRWVAQPSMDETATFYTPKIKGRTGYKHTLLLPAGTYRLRAALVWTDSKGVHSKWSSFSRLVWVKTRR